MLKRVLLYISKNFLKMISTLIMFMVMLSLIGTLVYVYSTVNNRVAQTGLIRRNYIVDSEKLYDGGDDLEFESYSLIYDEMMSLEGLEAYKIDFGSTKSYTVASEGMSAMEAAWVDFQIANDLKQIDFFTESVEIIEGNLDETGVVISQDMAEKYGVGIGSTMDISSFNLIDSELDFSPDSIISFSYAYEVQVSGIYSTKNESEYYNGSETIYLSKLLYDEVYEAIYAEELKAIPELVDYASSYPDFERILAQYDNKASAERLDKLVEDSYDVVYVVDSAKAIDDSVEPLSDFNKIILILIIVTTLISAVGIYLNMFLKLEKRRSEFIALLGCGINSFKLSFQVFFEQLIIAIIAIPFSYLFVNSLVKFVIEIIKKYYIVLIDELAMSGDEVYGSWFEYVTVDSNSIVDFTNANLLYVMIVAVAIVVVSLLLLCLFEVNRRYKNIKKV